MRRNHRHPGAGAGALPWLLLLPALAALAAACGQNGAGQPDSGGPAAPAQLLAPPAEPVIPAEAAPVEPPAVPPAVPVPPLGANPDAGPGVTAADPAAAERRNRELSAALGLPVYPAARSVPSLSSEAPAALRIVLTTDDPCDRVVRFYEQATGQVAQVTELSDGDIYDIVLKTAPDGDPLQGVQIRQTPRAVADRLTGRTSIILFRRSP